ncbi:hypothetical protein HDR63_02905 [bacterium]|nr:hypothetical protein [bacterium]
MNVLEEYSTDRGHVQLIEDDGAYYCDAVVTAKLGYEWRSTSTKTSYAVAMARYSNVQRFINMVSFPAPQKECAYHPEHVVACNYENCPKELGGAGYHQIYRHSCRYHKVNQGR